MTIMPDSATQSRVMIGPSVLSADFLRLGDQLDEMADGGADYVHVDVMDGRFVPNISIGLPVVEAIRRGTTLPVDVHLMIAEPDRWIERFAGAGATSLSVHVEATPHIHRVIDAIHERGVRAGVAVNPGTSIDTVTDLLGVVDSILVMTVNPGFGGQAFIGQMVQKVARLADAIRVAGANVVIQVDGGINAETILPVVAAGATSVVAGSAVLNTSAPVCDNIQALRSAVS